MIIQYCKYQNLNSLPKFEKAKTFEALEAQSTLQKFEKAKIFQPLGAQKFKLSAKIVKIWVRVQKILLYIQVSELPCC